MDTAKKIGTALLGYGLSGRVFHLPFLIHSNFFDIKVILTSKDVAGFNTSTDLDAILADPSIDLIINTLPNELHYEVSKKALKNNKHCVVEKPFTNSTREADELINLAGQKNKILTVFHNRRLDDDFISLKKLIKSNELGAPQYFESRFDRFAPEIKSGWRSENLKGSGVYFDLAPHLLDQAIVLFGNPVSYIVHTEKQRKGSVVDDFFEITLNYADFKVLLTASCLMKDKTPRLKFTGTKKEFLSFELDPQEALLKEGVKINSSQWKEKLNSMTYLLNFGEQSQTNPRVQSSYLDFYQNLYQAILQNDPEILLVKPSQARNVMDLLFKGFKQQDELITLK